MQRFQGLSAMQAIGLCRFSYPAIGGFQVDFDDFAEKLDYLYAPARMEERFATFETVTLPPLSCSSETVCPINIVPALRLCWRICRKP
jgi:hypothetical protein